MEIPVKILNETDFRVYKLIKIDGDEYNPFIGYIHYKRFLTKDYNSKTSDDYLDNLILEAIKKVYPTANLIINKDIIFEGEYDDLMKRYTKQEQTNFTIRFTPDFSNQDIWQLAGQEFVEYHPKFIFNIISFQENTMDFINDFGIAYIPFDKLKDFDKKLKTIDFK